MSVAALERTKLQQSSVVQITGAITGRRIQAAGGYVIRYGLVLVLFWIGAMKFTAYEAAGIQGLVANSPLIGWVYNFMSVEGFAMALGTAELTIALLIALKPFSARAAAIGSALAIGMFTLDDLVGASFPNAMARRLPVVRDGAAATVEGIVVVEGDLAATNGVVHVIDGVITPPDGG